MAPSFQTFPFLPSTLSSTFARIAFFLSLVRPSITTVISTVLILLLHQYHLSSPSLSAPSSAFQSRSHSFCLPPIVCCSHGPPCLLPAISVTCLADSHSPIFIYFLPLTRCTFPIMHPEDPGLSPEILLYPATSRSPVTMLWDHQEARWVFQGQPGAPLDNAVLGMPSSSFFFFLMNSCATWDMWRAYSRRQK